MNIIEIVAQENGAHQNQCSADIKKVPEGWAIIPDGFAVPDTFPFVNFTVNDGVVVSMTAGIVPEVEPVEEAPTQLDRIEAQVTYTAMMTDTLIEG